MTAAAPVASDWRTRSAKQTRLAFGQALLEIGSREPRAVVVSADTQDLLGIRPYIERYRDRFVEVGIAEQNAIGAASGLATTGLRPYVCAYAPFITARSMEQVRNDVAYANQRVVIGAAASGISLGVAGGTHHALEDLALTRSLPNMTVIVPADVDEAYQATLATLDIDGPVYLRLGGRVEEPPVSDPNAAFQLGRAVQLRQGSDVTVIACGALVEMAVRASDALRQEGVRARVLNMHTIKPLDRDAVLAAAEETRAIVTAEEHHLCGGLGGAVAEVVAREGIACRVHRLGHQDRWLGMGVPEDLMSKGGFDEDAIFAAAFSLLGRECPAPRAFGDA